MDDTLKIKSYTMFVVKSINILFSLYLVLSYTAPYINPNSISIVPFLGLTYPIALLMNVVFVMIWGILQSKWVFLSLSIVLLGLPFHLRVFSVGFSNDTIPKNANTLKVMSYNVRLFGYYSQPHSKAKQTRNDILSFIRKEDPDVLCLQEYFHQDGNGGFNTRDSIYNIMSTNSHHEKSKYYPRKKTHFGISLFSKFPIINKGVVHHEGSIKENSNYCIFSDIVKNNDTIRVYNVHFQSIKLKSDDYSRKTNNEANSQSQRKKFTSVISKLNKAFKIRVNQSGLVSKHIQDSPYKTVICGDFNDTPMSFTYQVFNNYLVDAFRNTSNGFGSTYNGYLPAGRIDYIFHSESLNSAQFNIQKEKLSDHLAISCIIF